MAWIESHQGLREHPKVYALCDALKISKVEAIGHLHYFWWWALDYAADGCLDNLSENQIARGMQWEREPGQLLKAMIDCHWIDEENGHRSIHDWGEYILHYNLLQQRKERQRKQIKKRVTAFRKRVRNVSVTQSNAATRPNQTIPNQPNQTIPTGPTRRISLDELRVTPDLEEWAQREGIPQPGAYLDEFKDYWKGEGKVKKDWLATFRNRLRYLKEKGRLRTANVWEAV